MVIDQIDSQGFLGWQAVHVGDEKLLVALAEYPCREILRVISDPVREALRIVSDKVVLVRRMPRQGSEDRYLPPTLFRELCLFDDAPVEPTQLKCQSGGVSLLQEQRPHSAEDPNTTHPFLQPSDNCSQIRAACGKSVQQLFTGPLRQHTGPVDCIPVSEWKLVG
ncbi:hypothetical protein Sgri01_02202 [Streptomyces griseus]